MPFFTANLKAVYNIHAPFEFKEDEFWLQGTMAVDNGLLNFLVRPFGVTHNYQHKGTV
jgi:hypothetical protein